MDQTVSRAWFCRDFGYLCDYSQSDNKKLVPVQLNDACYVQIRSHDYASGFVDRFQVKLEDLTRLPHCFWPGPN